MNQNKEITRLTYSVAEASSALGISSRMLHNFIKNGDIAVCRLGARVLIPADELKAFLEKRKQSPKS
jgi:excisionase family DNA binding protein